MINEEHFEADLVALMEKYDLPHLVIVADHRGALIIRSLADEFPWNVALSEEMAHIVREAMLRNKQRLRKAYQEAHK